MYKKIGFLFMIALLLPGCGRLIDWGKSRFYQGNSITFDHTAIDNYTRWATIYDQFTTVAFFDALWLSDPVRTVYARENSFREGKSAEHYKAFMRRQLEENNYFITFYVLASADIPLGDPSSAWKILLKVYDMVLYPAECKAIDLPSDYKVLLKKRITLFKDSYIVTFHAKTNEDKPIITPETRSLELHFRSSDKEVILGWYMDDEGKLKKPAYSGGQPLFGKKDPITDSYYEDEAHE